MRRAAAVHAWRRLSDGWDGNQGIETLSTVEGTLGFDPSAIVLRAGIGLVVGINSAGKSRLVRDFVDHVNGAGDSVRATWMGQAPARATYVDIAELIERQRITFASTPDLDEMREQAGVIDLRPSVRADVQYILGREYSRVVVAEIENPGMTELDRLAFRPDVVPYFRATTGGQQRDFRELSRGELTAFTLAWALTQIEPGTVMVLDEPDCFLSPAAAGRALDFIATSANDRQTTTLISSHSYLGIQHAPENTQVMLRLKENGSSYLTHPDGSALWNTLGVAAPRKIAIVVEDHAAKVVLEALMAQMSFVHADVTEVWIGGDAGTVLAVTRVRDVPGLGMRITGVVDGDERSALRHGANGVALPSNGSPEAHAIDLLRSDPESYYPGRSAVIVDKLNSTTGLDVHERLHEIATSLGLQPDHVLCHVWVTWAATAEGAEQISELHAWIRSLEPRT